MHSEIKENKIIISGIEDFDIFKTFDCGQCFRFDRTGKDSVGGVAFGRYAEFIQSEPDKLIIRTDAPEDFETVWSPFLALGEDYKLRRKNILDCVPGDAVMAEAVKVGSGIHILRQDRWEALCSFIISQNNNIPRIKKIIGRLSEAFGEEITFCGEKYYTFPSAKALAAAGTEKIFSCGTGFRAKYIFDASKKIISGELDLDKVAALPAEQAAKLLCAIKGVGPKVAACTLLFGFCYDEAFPIDVWVKRVLSKYYPEEFDPHVFGKYAGLAQQYLFYYEKYTGGAYGIVPFCQCSTDIK